MRKYFYILAISFGCFSCKREKISFTPLTQYENIDTAYSNNTIYTSKWLYYIINNYNDSDETLKAMDSCVNVVVGANPEKFRNFTIVFYKASDITNVQHLKDNPSDIDRYSQDNDMMFSYKWENGKFMGRSHLYK
jgi:adenine specific DNA methylase Mod